MASDPEIRNNPLNPSEPGDRQGSEVEVEIFGQRYLIKGAVEEKYVRDLASYLDEKMKEVAQRAGGAAPMKVAVLAALNMSHELLQLRKEQNEKEGLVVEKTQKIIELIEGQFKG
ncbi:MAG: cell division protein ZapA [Nitrospirae bacterium]|nr:cell division protein ZapA [Nitrospirota bacterium]